MQRKKEETHDSKYIWNTAFSIVAFLKADNWNEINDSVVDFLKSFHNFLSTCQSNLDLIDKLSYYQELQNGYQATKDRTPNPFLDLIDHFLTTDLHAFSQRSADDEQQHTCRPGLGN